jgi:hypothetical protein
VRLGLAYEGNWRNAIAQLVHGEHAVAHELCSGGRERRKHEARTVTQAQIVVQIDRLLQSRAHPTPRSDNPYACTSTDKQTHTDTNTQTHTRNYTHSHAHGDTDVDTCDRRTPKHGFHRRDL